jgi:hypothetical protein
METLNGGRPKRKVSMCETEVSTIGREGVK